MLLANRPVLVLNKNWQPIRVAPLEKAIVKLTSEYKDGRPKAKIIDPNDYSLYTWSDWTAMRPNDGEDVIRGVNQNYKIPEIIIVEHTKVPFHRVRFSRKMLYKRDGNRCQYCGKVFPTTELNVDHVLARSRGGLTTWENCVCSCIECNTKKGNLTLEMAGMSLIRQPFKPKYSLFKHEKKFVPKSWSAFVSKIYWEVELENDNE